jgi:hypothetical protein
MNNKRKMEKKKKTSSPNSRTLSLRIKGLDHLHGPLERGHFIIKNTHLKPFLCSLPYTTYRKGRSTQRALTSYSDGETEALATTSDSNGKIREECGC